MTSSRFRSLNAKLLAIYVPLVCLAVLILFAGLELRFYTSERNKLAASAQNIADVQGTGIGQAAWEYDEEQIQAQLSDLERLSQVQGAIVYDTSGQVLGRYGNPDEEPNRPDFRVERDLFFGHGSVREPVGHFVVTVHAGEVRKQLIARLKADGLILAVLAVALVGVTQVATGFVITRPLSRLRAAIEADKIGERAGARGVGERR